MHARKPARHLLDRWPQSWSSVFLAAHDFCCRPTFFKILALAVLVDTETSVVDACLVQVLIAMQFVTAILVNR